VSPSGSDSNPGTLTQPWKTIQKALDKVSAGQTILVRAGTYSQSLYAKRGGTSTSLVSLEAFPGEKPVLTRPMQIVANYIRVSGFVFEANGHSTSPIYVAGGDYVELLNNEVRNSRMTAIFLSGSNGSKLQGNWIHDNGDTANQDHGIYWWSGNSGLIADNLIERNYAFGIQLYPQPDKITVRDNRIFASGRCGVAIGTDGSNSADYNVILSNVIANNKDCGVTSSIGYPGKGNTLQGNTMYGNPKGNIWDPFGAFVVS
jgi:parallel beta-helix repeat protein